jgi:hypothetical protein
VLLAMLAPATAPAKAADDGSDYLTYTVRPGDTIYGRRAALLDDRRQWRELQATNRVRNPRQLQPGAKLQVPSPGCGARTCTLSSSLPKATFVPAPGARSTSGPACSYRPRRGSPPGRPAP